MQINKISFEVTALLGQTTLQSSSYFGLQVGDVIVLDQSIEKGVTVRIGFTECYAATIGLFGNHKAIVIDERIHPR